MLQQTFSSGQHVQELGGRQGLEQAAGDVEDPELEEAPDGVGQRRELDGPQVQHHNVQKPRYH